MRDEMIHALLQGEYDGDLDHLERLVRDRRRAVKDVQARKVAATLRVGDEAEVIPDVIRPKYLDGARVEIIKVNRTRAVVRVPNDPCYRKFAGAEVRCPMHALRVVA